MMRVSKSSDRETEGEDDKIMKILAGLGQQLELKIEKLKIDIVGEMDAKVKRITPKMDSMENSLNYAHRDLKT